MSRLIEVMRHYPVEYFVDRMEQELKHSPNMDRFIVPSTSENVDATMKLAKERFPQALDFVKFEPSEWLDCSGVTVIMKRNQGPNDDLIDIEKDNE
jgi:hypothetical protein